MGQAELRGMLRARLRADPELADQFAAFVAEVREQIGTSEAAPTVNQWARMDRGGSILQAGRDLSVPPLAD
jgi:hypothetical protein